MLALLLALICLRTPDGLVAERTRLAAAPHAFNLVGWEVDHLAGKLGQILGALRVQPEADAADVERIRGYFLAPVAARPAMRPEAEAAIQRLVGEALHREGLVAPSILAGGGQVVFPPVSFRFSDPPQVLVISPRERIEIAQDVLLRPRLSPKDRATIEDSVARGGVSTVVTPIGGLATYPAMVLAGASAQATLAAVAHEWAHAYFIFHPLGRGYWSGQEVRTINETAADLIGDELGRRLARDLDLPLSDPGSVSANPRISEFSRHMRETRLEVDRLLALGQVEEAERYMEQRRQELAARGYVVRRLNQAYFAFHGSYAEGPAGSSPIAGQVRRLRNASDSLRTFVQRIASVGSAAELERLAP